MFSTDKIYEKFDKRVWLSSPTMHGKELDYMSEAYNTNWMSTVGKILTQLKSRFQNI